VPSFAEATDRGHPEVDINYRCLRLLGGWPGPDHSCEALEQKPSPKL
jgi:hypothetical protein